MADQTRNPPPECPTCGAECDPAKLTECPFCNRQKCPTCDMGDDVGCLECDGFDDDGD